MGTNSAKIKGTASVIIPDIEVFWNENGCISIQQDADHIVWDEDAIVIVDRERAEALIQALRHVIDSEKDGA